MNWADWLLEPAFDKFQKGFAVKGFYEEFMELRKTKYKCCCCAAEIRMKLNDIMEKVSNAEAPKFVKLAFMAELQVELERIENLKDQIDAESSQSEEYIPYSCL